MVYHLFPAGKRNYALLFFSLLFYAWGAPKFIGVLLLSTGANFFLVRYMNTAKSNRKKTLLTLSVVLNLGLLAYCKYANFFVENVNWILGEMGKPALVWKEVLLPIGISFYTFQTITYSVDVYRKENPPLQRYTDYLLYILSFPQMIAGPIVRFKTVAQEIIDRKETYNDKLIGWYRFALGLAKKVLIANVMAEQADAIFESDFEQLSFSAAWVGILAYTFQIYFDFSGYSDMAIGLGRIMGFHFPENFKAPYTATSISDFWRKWHITLGDFMRDYLYIPLGGNRVSSKWRLYFNLWVVFLLSGLWHGASWNFVLWGAYHGFFLILDRLFLHRWYQFTGRAVANCMTFIWVVLGWVLFRIENLEQLPVFYGALASFSWSDIPVLTTPTKYVFVVAIFFSFIPAFKWGQNWQNWWFNTSNYTAKEHVVLFLITALLFMVSCSAVLSSSYNPFIYFRF